VFLVDVTRAFVRADVAKNVPSRAGHSHSVVVDSPFWRMEDLGLAGPP
jgi:hypothetical protein